MIAQSVLLGIASMALAGVAVSSDMVLGIVMLQKQWPYWRITAASCLLSVLLLAAVFKAFHSAWPSQHQLKWILLYGVFSALYWGIALLAAQVGVGTGDVASLTSINIVASCLLGRIFLNEALRPSHTAGAVLSLVGAVFIAKPSFIFSSSSYGPWYGYVFAMSSGFIHGGAFICARKAGDVATSCFSMSAMGLSVPFCILLPCLPTVREAPLGVISESPLEALFWLLTATLTSLASSFFVCTGSKLCPAAIAATVYTAASMISGYAVQALLFAQFPDMVTVLGAVLMLVAVLVMALADRGSGAVAQLQQVPPVDDDDVSVSSLASFMAEEFSFDDSMRFRARQLHQAAVVAQEFGLSI